MHHDFRYTQLVNLMRSASLCLYEVIETNYRACGSSCCDQLIPLMKCFSSGCSCRSSSTLWLRLFPLLSFRGEKTNSCWLEKSVNPQMERTICPCQLIPLMKCFYVQHVCRACPAILQQLLNPALSSTLTLGLKMCAPGVLFQIHIFCCDKTQGISTLVLLPKKPRISCKIFRFREKGKVPPANFILENKNKVDTMLDIRSYNPINTEIERKIVLHASTWHNYNTFCDDK